MAASTEDDGGSKKVYVGMGEKRIAIRMPSSLSKLLSVVREVYGVDEVQLWLDAQRPPRRPALGSELIETESDYRCGVFDGDAVVLVSGDQILQPTTRLVAALDSITTHRHDYTAKEIFPQREPYKKRCTSSYPKPDLGVTPGMYSTTYRRDYVKRPGFPAEEFSARYTGDTPCAFAGGTTYNRDYVEYPLPTYTGGDDNGRVSQYRPRSAPSTRQAPTTTYRTHFKGGAIPSKTGPCASKQYQTLPPGAAWRDTEYKAKYVPKKADHRTKPDFTDDNCWQGGDAPPMMPGYTTTYRRDYVPLPNSLATLNVEPFDDLATAAAN